MTMNIIFGKENAERLKEKYTVLELDTIKFGNTDSAATAYCIIEDMNFDEIPMIESMQTLHADLIVKYQSKNWTTCLEIIKRLQGFWNGELDSYYTVLQQRVENLLEDPPGPEWSPVIQK
jgi:hypothetical protein